MSLGAEYPWRHARAHYLMRKSGKPDFRKSDISDLRHYLTRKSGKPDFRWHPRLCSTATVKTWMAKPGNDAERVRRRYDAFFFSNIALMLSNNSILAPGWRMMTL